MEYAGFVEQLSSSTQETSSSPEQTRTVGEDLKLHAPKPSLPAQSAKQRVMAVTRTDSDRAASFGIGRPSSDDHQGPSSNRSLKKKASTTSQLSTSESHVDDEHGIPEIGQQVPMIPNAGDVQAPSPAPGLSGITEGLKGKHHTRKTSSRGILPPGSYGLHGHGVVPQDKLEKAYFEKHPDLLKKEHTPHHYDRPTDFSMSSEDLNKIVRETASRGAGVASKNYVGTPSDHIGWQAIDESTSRVTSPRPGSKSPPRSGSSQPEISVSQAQEVGHRGPEEGNVIHVDEPGRRKSVMFSDDETPGEEMDEPGYTAPILAEDEVRKDPSPLDHGPAVELPPERSGGVIEKEESSSRPSSRPTSRPASLYKETSFELQPTPLEDVEEYEPLFPDDGKAAAKEAPPEPKARTKHIAKQRFPSRDIWEDAPNSVHYTAEVSTPEAPEEEETSTPPAAVMATPHEGETPAQAFARHQEELAERDVRKNGPDMFLPMENTAQTQKTLWPQHQPHPAPEKTRPSMGQRFPSRDVWEDTPDSLKLETTVSTPQRDHELDSPADTKQPEIPQRPAAKKPTDAPPAAERPSIPERLKPKQSSAEEQETSPSTSKAPSIPDRPKPHVPARPTKAGPTSGGLEPAEAAAPSKQKPVVPVKPIASKIAALKGGFMSDLNKKLGLGPQAPKKEEPAPEEQEAVEEKEKAPLSDARKSRARGPQRRAPASAAKSPSPAAGPTEPKPEEQKFTLVLAPPCTLFEIDPDEGDLTLGDIKESVKEGPVVQAEPEDGDDEQRTKTTSSEPASSSETKKPLTVSEENPSATADEPAKETEEVKSLAANVAGETVVSEEIKKDEENQEVEPTKVEER